MEDARASMVLFQSHKKMWEKWLAVTRGKRRPGESHAKVGGRLSETDLEAMA